jgi:paired amphipathic helix protein Sin3a
MDPSQSQQRPPGAAANGGDPQQQNQRYYHQQPPAGQQPPRTTTAAQSAPPSRGGAPSAYGGPPPPGGAMMASYPSSSSYNDQERAGEKNDGPRQPSPAVGPGAARQTVPPIAASGPTPQQQPPPPSQASRASTAHLRELRVEDALLYLDHVKMEFKDRPQIYNEFLAIMKNFKTQAVDTPGVIRRVSKLFRGYNNLILGFNTFLPEGYKIRLADLERQDAEERAREAAATAQQQSMQGGPSAAQRGPPPPHQQQPFRGYMANPPRDPSAQPPKQQEAPRKPPPQQQPAAGSGGRGSKPAASQQGQRQPRSSPTAAAGAPPPQQHQAVEFDHAISYVTTIKRRFANDPSTYHQFLEILHTYQKEQRGIKEVLEQVAHLFQDHPDLLKEFTFFLPDAVQEQAKERLHRAAAESESRQRQAQMERYGANGATPAAGAAAQGSNQPHQQFIDMTRSHAHHLHPHHHHPHAPMEGTAAVHVRSKGSDGVSMEATLYNSAVERQFFDAAREALTSYSRDGGQAWAEFLKCLDMYAQDILSRSEMLNFVEPLLGKRNTKLFEEFKRILQAAGSPNFPIHTFMEDAWYSVPLSEIDFSRCRRCTPSYRALPRDYPAPPCSDRSEFEASILNDIWVSLPVGSEESYTFRHMRRNTYEETLFRVEDERFEIDMVIDSNATTLYRLEPIAAELNDLAVKQHGSIAGGCGDDDGGSAAGEGSANAGSDLTKGGLGGRRFQYVFDKNILGVIHRNAITRIYGDTGQEMLDLLVKNPAVAVPLVVQRLRQKDGEWRAVRDRLNRHWKELAQHNYYKSLDHRSLTWRTTDKRATSTRTLISEIKDRALHNGREGQEALKQKLDKAKEEHGIFYEFTMREALTRDLDLTYLPKPDRRLFTPHLSLLHENNSWAQRDAYRILSFALERGHITPADKERCQRLWIEFLGPFFGLSLNWMQSPAITYQESTALAEASGTLTAMSSSAAATATGNTSVVSEDDEEDSMEEEMVQGKILEDMKLENGSTPVAREFTDHHPLPAGAHVSTLYGQGKIVEFRKSDHLYEVELDGFGATAYLRPATVLSSMLPVEKSAYTRELRSHDVSRLTRPGDQLMIGTQSLYLFLRLHHILIRRLNIAKRLAFSVGDDKSMKTMVEQMPHTAVNKSAVGRRRYEAYLGLVYGLLDGGASGAAEGGKYEDRVRGLLGHGGYELATMDKLISHIWKNIQSMAGDETMWNLVQLYRRHSAAGSFQPEAFRQEAAYHSEGEPMYAFQYSCTGKGAASGDDAAVLYMEYLGVMDEEDDEDDDDEESVVQDVIMQNVVPEAAPAEEPAAVAASASEPPSKRARR